MVSVTVSDHVTTSEDTHCACFFGTGHACLVVSGRQHKRQWYQPTNKMHPSFFYRVRRCIAYGVLEDDEAAKLFKTVTKRKKGGKLSGSTPTPVKKKPSASGNKKKKARIIDDVGYDAGMQSGGGEGIGAAAL